MHKKNDREKCKTEQTTVHEESDSVLEQLQAIKRGMVEKLLLAKSLGKITVVKKNKEFNK